MTLAQIQPSTFPIDGLTRRRPASFPPPSATAQLTSVPEMSNATPSSRICSQAGPAPWTTNCGRKAMKKIATLGLSTGHVGAGRQVKPQRTHHEQRKKMEIEHARF